MRVIAPKYSSSNNSFMGDIIGAVKVTKFFHLLKIFKKILLHNFFDRFGSLAKGKNFEVLQSVSKLTIVEYLCLLSAFFAGSQSPNFSRSFFSLGFPTYVSFHIKWSTLELNFSTRVGPALHQYAFQWWLFFCGTPSTDNYPKTLMRANFRK